MNSDYKSQEYAVQGNAMAKQGHKCCGFCCDVRRATIIVNAVTVGLSAMGLLSLFALKGMAGAIDSSAVDDDAMAAQMAEMEDQLSGFDSMGPMVFIVQLVKIGCAIAGIFGGMKYSVPMVAVAAVSHGWDLVLSLLSFHIPGLAMAGGFLYPHIMFIQEMRKGIMTPENYPNEQHSCCCV